MAKTLNIRFDDTQEQQLGELAAQMHNTEAGIVRLAVDTLFKVVQAKQPPAEGQPKTFALVTSALG